MVLCTIMRALTRRKNINEEALRESHFQKYLSTLDLILLGVGNTLGAGVYVVTGVLGKFTAGPAMIFSFLIAAVVATLSVALGFGAKMSSSVNNIFAALNLFVIIYVIVCGMFRLDTSYWHIPAVELPKGPCKAQPDNQTSPPQCENYGSGGFMPYGFSGVMVGAAMGFYGFIGFDVISTAAEEAHNPQKSIPLSTMATVFFVFLSFFGVSIVLTMICPYYLLDEKAPLPEAFERIGWTVAKYVVTVGGIVGLFTSLVGCIFTLPRYIYSMASDGLLFGCLATVNKRFNMPVNACIFCGAVAGIMGMLLDIGSLVSIVAVGTLVPYALVAACVLTLRYEPDFSSIAAATHLYPTVGEGERATFVDSLLAILKQAMWPRYAEATLLSSRVVTIAVFLLTLSFIGISSVIEFASDCLMRREPWVLTVTSLISVLIVLLLITIARQHQSNTEISFKVPMVPVVPAASLFINIYLLVQIDSLTWARYLTCMFVGVVIYFGYGVWNSKECSVDPATRRHKKIVASAKKIAKETEMEQSGKSCRMAENDASGTHTLLSAFDMSPIL
ncbi:cationic amino acid transporter 2-like isoform X2 [Acanthaster planci]|nr:cationic amino acid transporter 2-like isoform X2 [Acanthaster planci]